MITVFDLYFASIVSLQYHPANPPDKRMSLQECAEVAMRMCMLRNEILGKD